MSLAFALDLLEKMRPIGLTDDQKRAVADLVFWALEQNAAPKPALVAVLSSAATPRYGIDPAAPEVAIRMNPDGRQERGRFRASDGAFIPLSSDTQMPEPAPKSADCASVPAPGVPADAGREEQR